ncbi:MAG: AMP-binding protein, partial [Micromonosporaceae bacterium]|nr:AMP-binding protein [Micromonosporaceae bacterium]
MTDVSSIAPLAARRQLMTEPALGAGNFLDHALAVNPNRFVPYAYSHHTDHRGEVVLRGHSLLDLAALRDGYAKWYWANGVRPGEPVGVAVAEGMEPLIHFLALSALGAIPAMINDAMRPDLMVRYLNHVGVVGIVADDTTRLAAAYRADPQRRPRFIALAAEVQAFDAESAQLPAVYPYQH